MKSEVFPLKRKLVMAWETPPATLFSKRNVIYDVLLYRYFWHSCRIVGTMFLVARALDAISDPCMGCWPIERALAGVNFVRGYCLGTAIRDRLCTGL